MSRPNSPVPKSLLLYVPKLRCTALVLLTEEPWMDWDGFFQPTAKRHDIKISLLLKSDISFTLVCESSVVPWERDLFPREVWSMHKFNCLLHPSASGFTLVSLTGARKSVCKAARWQLRRGHSPDNTRPHWMCSTLDGGPRVLAWSLFLTPTAGHPMRAGSLICSPPLSAF